MVISRRCCQRPLLVDREVLKLLRQRLLLMLLLLLLLRLRMLLVLQVVTFLLQSMMQKLLLKTQLPLDVRDDYSGACATVLTLQGLRMRTHCAHRRRALQKSLLLLSVQL